MFHLIYTSSIPLLAAVSFLCLAAWTFVSILFYKKDKERVFRVISIIIAAFAVVLVYLLGVYGRETGEYRPFYMDPFRLFYEAQLNREAYRSMFMNVLMFLPLGVSLPYALSFKSVPLTVISSVFTGTVISAVIEIHQYYLIIGQAESADILCNGFGMILGAIPYVIYSVYLNRHDSDMQ